jgi:hypothetical protein
MRIQLRLKRSEVGLEGHDQQVQVVLILARLHAAYDAQLD